MSPAKIPSTLKQIGTCGILLVVGIAITLVFQPRPWFHEWAVGLALRQQVLIAAGFAVFAAASTEIAFRVPYLRQRMVLPPAMRAIELGGFRPWAISLAAGLGEEILFRAALQPLIGIWLAAAAFALAHLRTAAFASSTVKKISYIANVFLAGLGLGLVFRFVGLAAAVLVHAIIDLAALLAMRKLQQSVASP